MKIQEMTLASHFLLIMAGIFAVAVVILFFWYDIPKCMRMVYVKNDRHIYRKKRYAAKAVVAEADDETMLSLGEIEQTQLIEGDEMTECAETEQIDTNQLELIQNIVKMQRENEVKK